MPEQDRYDYGFGTVWDTVYVNRREGYSTSVTGYHRHEFYELNLILSGNVNILLRGRSEPGTQNRMVLTRPGTPHYISCKPDTLYRRIYLVFTEAWINRIPEWISLEEIFGREGEILTLTPEQTLFFRKLIEQIDAEQSPFSKRMLTYYLLSRAAEAMGSNRQILKRTPSCVLDAIAYIEEHFADKIIASTLAKRLNVSRTTLMTTFKSHTDRTIGEYLTQCRVKNAVLLLKDGKTLEDVADQCGFADSSGLIRGFRRCFGVTPRQYLKQLP